MGVLTRDLTRLRNEILALRSSRQGLIHDLEQETADRRADVSQMLAHFSEGLGRMGRTTKAHCLGSISELKRTVADLRAGVRTDLTGVRKTWFGLGTPSSRAGDKPGSQATMEAGTNAKKRPSGTNHKSSREVVEGQRPGRGKRRH